MAVQALKPAASLANTDRTHSKLALARFIDAAMGHDAIRCPFSIKSKLAAGHLLHFAKVQLAGPSVPDVAALTTKLRFIVTNVGTPPLVAECLAMDVRRLASRAPQECAWRLRLTHRAPERAHLTRCAQRSPGHPSTLVEMLSTRVLAGAAARSSRKRNSIMIHAAPSQTRQPEPSAHLAACSRKWEQVSFPIAVIGMLGFDTSSALPGKGRLVAELCTTILAAHFIINGERGVSDAKLTDAAAGSDQRSERLLAHTRELREAIQ